MRAAAPLPDSQPQQASSQVSTIREFSNLVVVDVVVTDSQGNPVHGLSKDAFALTENGQAQTIRNFEEHTAVPASAITILPAPKLPPGLFSNRTPAVANGPVNVLLLDYLNTPVSAQPYARKQLMDYLDHAPPGTRIAIFGLTTQLSLLHGFTSDMSVLKNALDVKNGGAPQVSPLLDNPIASLDALVTSGATSTDITQQMIGLVTRFEAMQASFQTAVRVQYTLDGFDSLARYLVGIPGRKNVIWFSGSFPLDVEPNPEEEDPNDSVERFDAWVRETDNLLTRAQVAVYPVDERGLRTDPSQNFFDESGNRDPFAVSSAQAAAAATAAFLQQTAQEHLTMQAMAEDTGGHAFINTNGLTQAVEEAIENGSNYYTLTYAPTNTVWDSRFRAIKVKVDQPGVKLNYRNGYYAVDPNDRNKVNAAGAATALAQPTTMSTAMMHGGPQATEILFKVRIRPANAPPGDAVPASNQTNPAMNLKGPYRQYAVDLVPDAHAVSCREGADGNGHCAIEIWTFVYNSNGDKLITASNRIHRLLTPADYQKLLTGGMAFHQQISVPVIGQYYLRTAIHDMVSDRVGAVEIPVSAVARLDPLKQVAAAAPDSTAGEPAPPTNPADPPVSPND
jgi:VWFA-related protein